MSVEPVAVSALKVRFGVPVHGWMRVEIDAADARFDAQTSYTPCDSVREIVEALHAVAHGRAALATFNEEPARLTMTFTPHGAEVALVVRRFPDHRQIAGAAVVAFAIEAPRDVVLWAFWRGLRSLMGSITPDEYMTQMRRAFPVTEMRRLSAILRPT